MREKERRWRDESQRDSSSFRLSSTLLFLSLVHSLAGWHGILGTAKLALL